MYINRLLLCLLLTTGICATGQTEIRVGNFSRLDKAVIFSDWQPYTFSTIAESRYRLVRDGGIQVIQATSEQSASGLMRKISIDPNQHPILEWRWKVIRQPRIADGTTKAGDDHAARLYLIFQQPGTADGLLHRLKNWLGFGNIHALNYVWANRIETDTFFQSPFTDASMVIAVNSGSENTEKWLAVKRNVLEDYQKAFGKNPPPISAIAIMTDSDNTQSAAAALYGDILFRGKKTE